jgi:neutral ceramidase
MIRTILGCVSLLVFAEAGWAAPFLVGAATADVTPPPGLRRSGDYQERFGDGVNDPLLVKALYFEQGDEAFALVVCDQTGLAREITDPIRDRAAKSLGIASNRIVLTATHTHGGVQFYDPVLLPLYQQRAKDEKRAEPHDGFDYTKRFSDRCIEALVAARKAKRPASLLAGTIAVPRVAFNRRYFMQTGPVRFNPGKLNPGIVRPAGPSNDAFQIFAFADASGKPFAALSTFPMHVAVFGGSKFGACFPGALQAELRKSLSPEFVSVFGEGTAGDMNHVNVSTKDPDPDATQIGRKLAARFMDALPTLRPVDAKLKVLSSLVPMPLHANRPEDLVKSKDLLVGPASRKAGFLEQVDAYRILLVDQLRKTHGDTLPDEVHAVRFGADAALVLWPHEVFLELGLAVRGDSPFRNTMVLTMARDVDFYVPTKKAYGEGSYEVVNSPIAPGGGEKLVDAAGELLKSLAKDR